MKTGKERYIEADRYKVNVGVSTSVQQTLAEMKGNKSITNFGHSVIPAKTIFMVNLLKDTKREGLEH